MEEGAKAPSKAHADDTGYDLYVWKAKAYIQDGMYGLKYIYVDVDTGVAVQPPEGFATDVRPKSRLTGTCWEVPNSPGTIDHSYRGNIRIKFRTPALIPEGPVYEEAALATALEDWHVGKACAQLIVTRLEGSDIEVVDTLDDTERGDGGFGSTEHRGH